MTMPSEGEIRSRINSIQSTQKITSAMYMISSTKMRRAKEELDKTRPFFELQETEIKRISRAYPTPTAAIFIRKAGERRPRPMLIWSLRPTKVWPAPTITTF